MSTWRKSSYSGTDGQSVCVEVAGLSSGVGIRDSKNPELGYLVLSPGAFAALLAHAKREQFNR